MRTTLVLNDALVVEAKKRAAEAQVSFSEWVNRALRDHLNQHSNKESIILEIPVYAPNHDVQTLSSDPEDFKALMVAEDIKPYSKKK